jgi:iron complex transport system permease protein
MRSNRRAARILLPALLLLILLAGLHTGHFPFTTAQIFKVLSGGEVPNGFIILNLRLPRLLLAFTTGGILSLGGFYMQALIRNPLADPYIMGLTAGSGFGVNLLLVGLIPVTALSAFTFPLAAFLGGLVSLLLVMLLGYKSFYEDNSRLLIAGVAVSAIFMALTGLLIYRFADSDQLQRIIYWTFGSFALADWKAVWVTAGLLLAGIVYGRLFARRMDLLLLGEMQAKTLGMSVPKVKFSLLLAASFVVGGTVAFTGPIGFVGMMIPHFCRALFGSNHRYNMVLGALMGGSYLCICDLVSRWILPPAGLPIGIVTAILGVPFFLYVLFSDRSYL